MKMAYAMEGIRIFLQYGLPALMVGGSSALSILLLNRMKELQGKVVRGEEELKSATATWMRSVAAMGKEIEGISEAVKHPCSESVASATRRKVLKMHRLGGSVEQIAKALHLSKGEVMLLLKVHTIILRPVEPTAGGRDTVALEQKS
jgi:DNA-binding NarL/FixJ family response regulator